jgi:DNA-binding GntR family transcriptional regulator
MLDLMALDRIDRALAGLAQGGALPPNEGAGAFVSPRDVFEQMKDQRRSRCPMTGQAA